MAVEGDYPLLILPTGTLLPPIQRAAFGDGARNPTKARQLERLGRAFLELQKALERQSALLSETATGYGPEHVLVFETNGPAKALLDVISGTPDLEWLIEHDERVAQDEDYKIERKPDKELNATLYMVMFNQVALEQLLSAWNSYSSNKRLPRQLRGWLDVFRCLRAIRRWGPEDRLREAGLLSDVLMPIDPNRHIPVEIELWPRAGERRQRAEQLVRTLVDAADGRVLHTCSITEIRYHALLVELPSRYLLRLLEVKDVELLQADDIYLIRPTAQAVVPVEEPFETEERRATSASVEGEPICALLDGLPMENHPLLQNRLLVDDPDFLASTYPVTHRRHGTAMASLIIHGDQHEQQPSLDRPLYVRPILALDHGDEERAPRSRLWVDLIHQAVRRIVAEDVPNGPVAPSVKLINLSVGDAGRPFLHEPSPLARLLDWLSWKHQILFMVSAGNHRDDLPPECRDDVQALRHVFEQRRHRSLLSPAELISGITVGASNEDGCKALIKPGQQAIPQRPSSAAVYSALGRGMKRSVKPDVLAPGGRLLYQPRIPIGNANWTVSKRQTLGHLVATPGPPGATRLATLTGTSNAAALATLLA